MMKRGFSLFLAGLLVILMLGAAFAESATTDATSSATQAPASGNGQPSGTPGLMGTITALGDNTLTITTGGGQPPQDGNGPQGGNGQQGGTPPQGGNGQQGGTPPQGGNGQQGGTPPQGDNGKQGGNNQQGGTPPQGGDSQTAPESKSVTITVTGSTTFTLRDSTTAIAFTDLTVGMMVNVTATGDDTTGYTATAIEAVQSAPTATAAPTATSGV